VDSNNGSSFKGGKILKRIGAAWFVSYHYYNHIDPDHTNWKSKITKKSLASRISKYKNSQNYHQTWLCEVLNMERLDMHKNSVGLCSDELKKMVKILMNFESPDNVSEDHTKDRENFACALGLKKVDDNFHAAFNFTKIEQRAKGNKGGRANSALATLGDAVLKLHLTKKLFLKYDDAENITKNRIAMEKGATQNDIAVKFGLDKLSYAAKNQESDQLPSDYATLFEAVIGAVFLNCGYDETAKILSTKFEL